MALLALQTCAVPHRLLRTAFPRSTGRAFKLCLQLHLSRECRFFPTRKLGALFFFSCNTVLGPIYARLEA